MSEAAEKLARSRRAILDHVARRERRHDPRQVGPEGAVPPETEASYDPYGTYGGYEEPGGGWFDRVSHGVRTWWRYHPASSVAELALPLVRGYARRKPAQVLGISFAVGAALMLARPWKLISVTTLLVALLKSSQLSSLLMAAMSAADYRKDAERP